MRVAGESSIEFADYGDILRRRWWVVLLGIIAGSALAAAALQVVPKTYASAALVQVKSVGEEGAVANGRTSSDLNLDTEAQLVTSNSVATRVQDILNTDTSTPDLAENVTVTVPPNTSVLSVGYSAGSRSEAQSGAQAFAEAYLANRKQSAQDDLNAQADTIRAQIKVLQEQLTTSNKRLAALSQGSAERASEEATNSSLVSQIHELNSELTPLIGQDVNPGSIITAAQLPNSPSSPSTKLLLASGLLTGLLAGCLIALAVDRLDRRIRDRKDLERLGLDTMTGVVAVPAARDGGSSLASGPGAEALRQLRNALMAQMPRREGSVIVANASDADGGSAVSVSLAVTIARSGADVILLSANTLRCAVEQAFPASDRPGLVDVLRDRATTDAALSTVASIPNLRVMTAGADGSLSSDLLQGPKIEAVIRDLVTRTDVAVVDVAPTAVNADAQTLVTASDGVLMVATALKTTRDQVLDAVDQFEHVSARVFGSAVVTVNREKRAGDSTQQTVGTPATSAPATETAPKPEHHRLVAVSRAGHR